MPTLRPLWLGVLAIALLLTSGLAPAYAAGDGLITITKAADLMMPPTQVPAGFTPDTGHPFTDNNMAPLIGLHMLAIFHQSGLIAGYHGWLDGQDPNGAPFVTYDLFGFASIKGARNARLAYQQLVLGVQLQSLDSSLPKSATVWTDGTGTFGPNNQPYAVAEIVFRVANVVGDVTGYYAGGGGDAIAAALHEATVATVACVHWLSTRLPAAGHSSLLPLVPFMAVPEALRRAWRRRG
jgi:hypothetical protein